MRLGRLVGSVVGATAGFFMGGPAGAVAGGMQGYAAGHGVDEAQRGRQESKKVMRDQMEAQGRQEAQVRSEQARINKNLEESQARRAAGVARGARSRIRGGLFGDSPVSSLPYSKD